MKVTSGISLYLDMIMYQNGSLTAIIIKELERFKWWAGFENVCGPKMDPYQFGIMAISSTLHELI